MTITEAELDAMLTGEAPDALHAVCGLCYPPPEVIPAGAIAICGNPLPIDFEHTDGTVAGERKCALCLAAFNRRYPCGH